MRCPLGHFQGSDNMRVGDRFSIVSAVQGFGAGAVVTKSRATAG